MNRIETIRNNIRNRLEANKQVHRVEKAKKTNTHSNKYYGSSLWHHLRNAYYVNNPLCEVCLRKGIVKSANEIHHKRTFSSGKTDEEKWNLLLDVDNLISVCKPHHHKFHEIMRAQNRNEMSIEELLQYEAILNNEY